MKLINLPNIVTCGNLYCGCLSIYFGLSGQIGLACLFILGGAIFDFLDGLTARAMHISGPIGKELDSLADVVTFGVAPSAMLFFQLGIMEYPSVLESYRNVLPYCAFLMAAFSALRLAKFNLDERQTTSFIGLPTPANALFWGALIVGGSHWIEASKWMLPVVVLLMLVSCWLLVSEIPMFALKFKQWGWRGNEVKYIFVATSAILVAVFRIPGIALVIAWYVLLSAVLSFRK